MDQRDTMDGLARISAAELMLKPDDWFPISTNNPGQACHTCTLRKVQCGFEMPCTQIFDLLHDLYGSLLIVHRLLRLLGRCHAMPCGGYGVHTEQLSSLIQKQRRRTAQLAYKQPSSTRLVRSTTTPTLTTTLSTLALPTDESFLLQHYIKNVSRITVAIDYDGNGFRTLVRSGINDPSVLNAVLGRCCIALQ